MEMYEVNTELIQNQTTTLNPTTKYNYESNSNSDLYFIGSLMHLHDFKKGSGGFIHGYVGNLVNRECLHPLQTFPLPECAYHVDDQWMSIYYFLNNIKKPSSR